MLKVTLDEAKSLLEEHRELQIFVRDAHADDL